MLNAWAFSYDLRIKFISFTSWLVEPFVTSVKEESERIDHNTPTETESGSSTNGTVTKHDDATKAIETSPAIVFGTIAKFISIMGVFAALTYYVERILMRKKLTDMLLDDRITKEVYDEMKVLHEQSSGAPESAQTYQSSK